MKKTIVASVMVATCKLFKWSNMATCSPVQKFKLTTDIATKFKERGVTSEVFLIWTKKFITEPKGHPFKLLKTHHSAESAKKNPQNHSSNVKSTPCNKFTHSQPSHRGWIVSQIMHKIQILCFYNEKVITL